MSEPSPSPPPAAPSSAGRVVPTPLGVRLRARLAPHLAAARAAGARLGPRGRWAAAGTAAVGVVGIATAALLPRVGSSDARADAAAPAADLATIAIEPCRGVAPPDAAPAPADPAAAPPAVVTGPVDGRPVLEVLRERALGPDEIYRVRQAFEGVPGWGAVDRGWFGVALRPGSAVVDRLELVAASGEAYRATTDPAGHLIGARIDAATAPVLCHASVRLGGSLTGSIEGSALTAELAPALRAAFAGRVDLDASAGAELRVVARERRVLDTFAGYDGFAIAEVRVGGDAAGDTATVRAHGPAVSEADRGTLDARLASLAWGAPFVATRAPDPTSDGEAAVDDAEEAEPPPDPKLTVEQAARKSCSTRIVAGLSRQIIEESRCLDPDAFVRVPARKNLVSSGTVFLYLAAPARDRLLRVLDAHPDVTMTVNSALRTVAQQVLLSKWGANRRCGVPLAAKPGESNHETGLALDVKEAATWRKPLEGAGFKWMGRKDPVHFDYAGPKAIDHRGLDVRAFQRLWTRNHPDDPLAETGKVDPRTASRLAKAPAAGFPTGARCDR